MTSPKRRILVVRVHRFLAVKNGNFGLWRDTNQTGFGLNADTHAKRRGESRGVCHGRTTAEHSRDAKNRTAAVQADDITTRRRNGKKFSFGFLRSKQTRLRGLCGTGAARSASSRSRPRRSPIPPEFGIKVNVSGTSQTHSAGWASGVCCVSWGVVLSGGFRVCRRVGLIFVAGVTVAAGAELPQGADQSAFPIPMETKTETGRR